MNILTRNPLRIVAEDGSDLVTEPVPGQFRFSTPKGFRYSGVLQRQVDEIVNERLEACVPDPERALQHWTKAFRRGQ